MSSALDEGSQSCERLIPLLGNEIEVVLNLGNRFRVECKSALTAGSNAAHDSRVLEHPKVLGDRLTGQPRTLGQLRERTRLPARKLGNQPQPRLIAQRGKDPRAARPASGTPSASFSQDRPQGSSFARPSRLRFCEMPQDGDPQAACQSRIPSPSAACHWRFSPAGIKQACSARWSNPPDNPLFHGTWDAAK